MRVGPDYDTIATAVAATGMVARGGFATDPADSLAMPDGQPVRTVVVIGNVGDAMWSAFRRSRGPGPDPLDTWTRSVLGPIAEAVGAAFVHPSDRPFRPFQHWARRADAVWSSPIGLLVHAEYGLWHAYRGAFLFEHAVTGLPSTRRAVSPCIACADRPCLTSCPVDAFGVEGYDSAVCAGHVRSAAEPDCLHDGCAARAACPVGSALRYGAEQMEFHMRAFIGDPS